MTQLTTQQAEQYATQIADGDIELQNGTLTDDIIAEHPEYTDRWFVYFTVGDQRYWFTNTDDAYAVRVQAAIRNAVADKPLNPDDWSTQTVTGRKTVARLPRRDF